MLCRTLLTAIAISYLICVLWLSGLQKEDLDVNMLRKLQRHNVNIDDMNSESLRKVCLNYKIKNKTEGQTVPVDEENRTTQATLFTENDITRKILKAENDEMSQMLKDFDDNQETMPKETSSINRRKSKLTKMLPSENDISVQNSSQETTESTNLIKTTKSETIEVLDQKEKLNLNRVIQFWQKFSTANTLDDTDIVNTSPKPKINLNTALSNAKIEDTQNIKNFGYINSFFMNLINKHTKVSTTTTSTTTTTIPPMVDLNNLSHQIKTLMKLLTQKNNDNLDETSPGKSIYNDFKKEKALLQQKASVNFNKERQIKNNSPINIHDMLMFNDRLKKSSIISIETNQSNDRVLFVNEEQKSKYPYNVLMNVTTDLPATISTTHFATKQTSMLSKDVINEIAENVKAIVLKDLQMSIASTTTLTPKRTVTSVSPTMSTKTLAPSIITTTVAAITGKNTTSKPDETKHVLEKFKELFEQLKTIKDKNFRNEETIITKTTTIKTCANNSNAKIFPPPILQMSAPMLLMDAYRIKKPPEFNPMMLSSYPTIPVPNVPVYPNVPVLSSHVVNPFLPSHEAMKINVAPIIQTNLEEIPPLGIPMSKPSILIHQNIIVTTKQPHNSSQSAALSHRIKYLSDSDHSSSERNRRERFYKHLNPSPSKYLTHHPYTTETNNAKDYFKFSSRLTYPKHISAVSLGYNNERITHSPISYHNSRYETFLNSNGNDHYHEKHNFKLPIVHQNNNYGNKKRERFHEKLERIVDWHEDNGRHIDKGQHYERNKLNIISRQQKPLGEIKKPTKYDDTHFQNFLHSQQKVNEMLEKILTSKTIVANEPVSVEIA